MSCPSSQNPLVLNVSMGNLPEGFCPATLQEFANALVARIIISPSEASLNIAGGSTEPASNIGPWFKNCEQIFVFDDTLGRYRPIQKGGFDSFEVKSTDGSFIVPDNVYKLYIEAWGGGGGGCNNGAASGGGSSGAYGSMIRAVTPGQVIPFSVGLGGAAGNPGAAGTSSIILGMDVGGGFGGLASGEPVLGGVTTGSDFNIIGGTSFRSGGNPGYGGDAPRGGGGGQFHQTDSTFSVGHTPGGGGTGSHPALVGREGAPGQILIWY